MKNLEGEEWQMGVRLDTKFYSERYYLSTGWPKFRKANNLSKGDECVLKFIRNESKLCLDKVTKKELTAPQAPPRGGTPSSDDECVEVVKQPLGRPPKQKFVM